MWRTLVMDRRVGQTWRIDMTDVMDRCERTWWTDVTERRDGQTWWKTVTDRREPWQTDVMEGRDRQTWRMGTWQTDVMDRCNGQMRQTSMTDRHDGQTWWTDMTDWHDGQAWRINVTDRRDRQTWRAECPGKVIDGCLQPIWPSNGQKTVIKVKFQLFPKLFPQLQLLQYNAIGWSWVNKLSLGP